MEGAVSSTDVHGDLVSFLALAASGGLRPEALVASDLTAVERALLSFADSLAGKVDLARRITEITDKSRKFSSLYPALRWFRPSDLEKEAVRDVTATRSSEKVNDLTDLTGLPIVSLGDAAASLMRKVAERDQSSPASRSLSSVLSLGARANTAAFRDPTRTG
jgi:hypothetical protein